MATIKYKKVIRKVERYTQVAMQKQMNADEKQTTQKLRKWAEIESATREINLVSSPVFHIHPNIGTVWQLFQQRIVSLPHISLILTQLLKLEINV